MQKEQERLHELTNSQQCFKPVPELIGEINQQLQSWKNYFSIGYPQAAYWEIDWYVRERLIHHLQRRSQRGFEFPKDRTIFRSFGESFSGKPDAGKPARPVWGGGGWPLSVTCLSTLPAVTEPRPSGSGFPKTVKHPLLYSANCATASK